MVSAMLDSIKKIQTIRFTIQAVEKVGDKYLNETSENKLQVSPRKLYFINRKKKLEILYAEGENGGKAVVKPHVFPYVTMQLQPTGNLMRKNQHYTINELGFEFLGTSIAKVLSKEKDNFLKCLTYYGKHEKNGYKCHAFVYEAKHFPYIDYVVKEKETVTSIALKQLAHEYIIRLKNKLENEFDYLKPGTKLKLPQYYCKKAVIFLDEKTMLPVSVSIFDENGLIEGYDYTGIILNKPFDPNEFKKNYKDYHF